MKQTSRSKKGMRHMLTIRFYDPSDVHNDQLVFAVIITRHGKQWVFCKHKDRETYEFPGGHHEIGETIRQTAKRELYEETGALDYELKQVCAYSVTGRTTVNDSGEERFGMLFFADVRTFEPELHYEIENLLITDVLPQNWTYPEIQPVLMEKAISSLKRL
jgi:8-oxo-dGTP diphosphatase